MRTTFVIPVSFILFASCGVRITYQDYILDDEEHFDNESRKFEVSRPQVHYK